MSEPGPRAGAVLYAKDVDRVAAFYAAVPGFETAGRHDRHVVLESRSFQLVILRIPSRLAAVRASAARCGGVVNDAEAEWTFDGWKVCDGLDPEGNVVQFREKAV